MGGGAAAARAYIARTNPNGNSSLGGASPIMHTPVLTGRSLDLLLSFSLSLSSSLSLLLFLISLQSRSLSLSLSLSVSCTPSRVALSTRGTAARYLGRQSYVVIPSRTDADAVRAKTLSLSLSSFLTPLSFISPSHRCDYSHPANAGF